jgi:hypothetical protein
VRASRDLVVNGNREMVTDAVRTVAAEAKFEDGRYSVEEAVHTDYGPCLVVRIESTNCSGWIGQLALQQAPKGLIVKILPEKSDCDPDGSLFQHFLTELIREFGRRGIISQA